jgi:hypothetical protein
MNTLKRLLILCASLSAMWFSTAAGWPKCCG